MTAPALPQVVLASRNKKKSAEIDALLRPWGIQVVPVSDFENVPEVVEDGETFAANAAKKAIETARIVKRWTIGEDSGLRVDALQGAPGVYSARYSGPDATDERNNEKLIKELEHVETARRGGEYVCHVAVADPQGNQRLAVEATCRGGIAREARGTNGFGYDPYFEIVEYHQTFGELSSLVKQTLSHRARAFQRLIPQLVQVLHAAQAGTSAGKAD